VFKEATEKKEHTSNDHDIVDQHVEQNTNAKLLRFEQSLA
jgi:hypothetical protein